MMKTTLNTISAIAYLAVAVGMASASDDTIGPNGINSVGLTLPLPNGSPLTGDGIGIGQVEFGRPMDPDLNDAQFNPFIDPEITFFQDNDAMNGDMQIDTHALHVAGIMISSDTRTGDQLEPPDLLPGTAIGVAREAALYASASRRNSDAAQDHMIAANHVATRNGGDVRAINMSFAHIPGGATQWQFPIHAVCRLVGFSS